MNQKNQLSPAALQHVERFGFFLERSGHPPAAARVLALLLIGPPSARTFEDIRDTLGLSKGAVSGGLKHLQQTGRVVAFKKSGLRKRWFRAALNPTDGVARFMAYSAALRAHLEEGLRLSADAEPDFTAALRDNIDFLGFLTGSLQDIEARWRLRQQEQRDVG
ncbi:MAG: MarR family transcriptional regulator [Alphaproteobacteria bacterium]|nr:MarR family transcriptional regulator [Alphaproteobacteria bacterium]